MQKNIKDKVNHLLIGLEKRGPIPEETFNEIVESFDFKLPETYVEVMKGFNGVKEK